MKIAIFSTILVVGLAGFASAEPKPQLSPEYAPLQEVVDEMTPQQWADVQAQAKKMQAELEKMSPAEQQQFYEESKRAVAEMDIGSVDTPKLNTKEKITLKKVDDRMEKLHKRQK